MDERLANYLQRWSLSAPSLIAQTPTSTVYTVQLGAETAVLKLLTPIGVEDERSGALALRYYDGHGAVQLLQATDDAHLLEYAEGESLVPMVEAGEDERATRIIAETLARLHSVELHPPLHGLHILRRRFRALFARARADQANGIDSHFRRAAPLVERLLNDPREERVLHGDMHHENIQYKSGRGWLAFDPKGVFGDRAFDTANALCNPYKVRDLVMTESRLFRNADILADSLHIERTRVLDFLYGYACLSAAWGLESDASPDYAFQIAEIAAQKVKSREMW